MEDILNRLAEVEQRIIDRLSEQMVICQDETKDLLKGLAIRVGDLETFIKTSKEKNGIWDRKFRRNNLILFGVNESQNEVLPETVLTTLNNALGLNLVIRDINNAFRLGRRQTDKCRPILIEFISNLTKLSVLKSSYKFKDSEFSISQDRSPEDKILRSKLLAHQREAKQRDISSKIVNNKLMVNGQLYTLDELDKLPSIPLARDQSLALSNHVVTPVASKSAINSTRDSSLNIIDGGSPNINQLSGTLLGPPIAPHTSISKRPAASPPDARNRPPFKSADRPSTRLKKNSTKTNPKN